MSKDYDANQDPKDEESAHLSHQEASNTDIPSNEPDISEDYEVLENTDDTDVPEVSESTEATPSYLSGSLPVSPGGASAPRHLLQGMYQNWFLEYASYVILERAVPNLDDGLKPVQRRILHTMKKMDDGRFIKVANITGATMAFHPHGDQSINDALVQLGQKDLLVETQGNWGNIITGAPAAAGRYIEARLSAMALEVVFSPKVTEWTPSYDGRDKEPVVLPSKFPLLLAQGAEGIAVGLSSKILPHNFNEIIEAAVAHLRGEEFTLLPDFVTGGMIDVSKYNDGKRGGALKIRAKIEKVDQRTLAVTQIPYGKTTGVIIDSILKAYEKGKIKIRKVENLTAKEPRIVIHLMPGTSSDKTIDALYAFTDCEVSVSPNCCVIYNRKPCFLGVSDVLRHSAENTRRILRRELEIELGEVRESLMFASLERYFIEKRIYKDKAYEQAPDLEAALTHVDERLTPIKKKLWRDVTRDDLLRLLEIKMKRILKFNADDADRLIARYEERARDIQNKIDNITEYTINWFLDIKARYGEPWERKTIIRNFNAIEAAQVVEATEKLYIDREEGFIGTSLKRDSSELLFPCSALDDIIVFYKDGRYKVMRVADKIFVGKNVLHVGIFKKNDNRTHYNVIYQNGRGGAYYMKRFTVTGVTRDKEYNVTQDRPENPVKGSRIVWFTANPNGEAEVVRVTLKPKLRLKLLHLDVDFGKLRAKNRNSMGNLVTRNEVHRFSLKEKGASTLGGRQVWFDPDVLRINYEGRGKLLGEFQGDDRILVICKDGSFFTTSYEATNHYEDNILDIRKFKHGQIFTAMLSDADNNDYLYIKRFNFENSAKKQRFLGENPRSVLLALSDKPGARFIVTPGGADSFREAFPVDANTFVGVKSFKAKGKRVTTYDVASVVETDPDPNVVDPTEDVETADMQDTEDVFIERPDDVVRDEIRGQGRLFDDDSTPETEETEN